MDIHVKNVVRVLNSWILSVGMRSCDKSVSRDHTMYCVYVFTPWGLLCVRMCLHHGDCCVYTCLCVYTMGIVVCTYAISTKGMSTQEVYLPKGDVINMSPDRSLGDLLVAN